MRNFLAEMMGGGGSESPPLVDWISHGITNWIYSDPDPFVSHAKNLGPVFSKYFAPMYPLAEDMSKNMGPML